MPSRTGRAGVDDEPRSAAAVGDPLLTIEAMKMETALHADTAGTIYEVVAREGTRIDSKDLLLVLSPAS